MKTATRQLAEAVQAVTKQSLVMINAQAFELINGGLCQTREEALQTLLEIAK